MYFSRVRIRSGLTELSELARILKNNSHGLHRLLWKLFPDQTQRTFLYREEIAREQLGVLPGVRGEPVYYLVSKSRPVVTENSLFNIETKPYQPQLKPEHIFSFECRVNPIIAKKGKKHDVVMNAQQTFLMSLIKECHLERDLSANMKKKDHKQLLLSKGDEVLNRLLVDILSNDPRYSERLNQASSQSDKLEWALKAQIDRALENWWEKQGEQNYGFSLVKDKNGLTKLQHAAYQWHALPEKNKNAGFSSVDLTGELQITDVEQFMTALFGGIGRSKAFGCGLLMIRRA